MIEELQTKCLIRVVKENIEILNDDDFANKISFLMLKKDKASTEELRKISQIYNMIDRAIRNENSKAALRYSCILKMKIKQLEEAVEKISL